MRFQKILESSGIIFAALLVFAAIAFAAFTTWPPGDPPAADPGEGNVAVEGAGSSSSSTTRGYISGLNYKYLTSDDIAFSGGVIEIEDQNYFLDEAINIDMDARFGSAFETNKWYYIYIDPPSTGNSLLGEDFEVSKDAPNWSDSKISWRHPTNFDWRCIGILRTNASANIAKFRLTGGYFSFDAPIEILNTYSPASSLTAIAAGTPLLGELKAEFMGHWLQSSAAIQEGFLAIANGDSDDTASMIYFAGAYHEGQVVATLTAITNLGGQIKYHGRAGLGGTTQKAAFMKLIGFYLPRGLAI